MGIVVGPLAACKAREECGSEGGSRSGCRVEAPRAESLADCSPRGLLPLRRKKCGSGRRVGPPSVSRTGPLSLRPYRARSVLSGGGGGRRQDLIISYCQHSPGSNKVTVHLRLIYICYIYVFKCIHICTLYILPALSDEQQGDGSVLCGEGGEGG